jgi:hypothetical protein
MSILPISTPNSTLISKIHLPFLTQVIPQEVIEEVLQQNNAHAKRERKLCMPVIVWWIIAMHLYVQEPMYYVFEKISAAWMRCETSKQTQAPGASALVYRRYQLGARPLFALFHRICRPLASASTQGSFLFGLKLLAIDGQVLSMPDTPCNDRYFGRSSSQRGASAYPQAQAVYLCECGTHAIIDAGLWPYRISEHIGARRMLRNVGKGTLVMWDRGLYSYGQFCCAMQKQAHVLCRIASTLKPSQIQVLPDGSRLVRIFPNEPAQRRYREYLDVRLIEYTLNDPALPGHGETHRLITTLLDPQLYPGVDLVCAYHQRWEIEGTADEIETHQCGKGPALRSLKPIGVIQEFYGLLMAHYLVRFWIYQSASQQDLDPDRISFIGALRLIGDMAIAFAVVPPELWPELCETVLQCIGRHRLPPRRHRSYPRVVKRKMSNFELKKPEHNRPPKLKRTFKEAVCLI